MVVLQFFGKFKGLVLVALDLEVILLLGLLELFDLIKQCKLVFLESFLPRSQLVSFFVGLLEFLGLSHHILVKL